MSTIVTFCEDGPHDSLYFENPEPMFRGDPRSPWVDVLSPKLLQRHLSMIVLQKFTERIGDSLDHISVLSFMDDHFEGFADYLSHFSPDAILLKNNAELNITKFKNSLLGDLKCLKFKRDQHPELYGISQNGKTSNAKSMLDALFEDGIVPTYSFPKNVVSTYITDKNGKLRYQVERGLDVAIGEYAPGRAIVVNKQTYQIGGLYCPGAEFHSGNYSAPARAFVEDPNYLKDVLRCDECGWFGLKEDCVSRCPFCGNPDLSFSRQMLRPWGFAPRNAESIQNAQLDEEYTYVQQPLYSTLPSADDMKQISVNIRMASRTSQRIIMMNEGTCKRGFMLCKDCGAAYPGEDPDVLNKLDRPYKSKYTRQKCKHTNSINVNLGFDFVTDMLVLEIFLDNRLIDTNPETNPWLNRAAQSFAEALRLVSSKELDIDFSELVTGFRRRINATGTFLDIYLYDALSSGAGYAVSVSEEIDILLAKCVELLRGCNCNSACHNCLKHYRNQHVHSLLDRKAGLYLLEWALNGKLPDDIDIAEQKRSIDGLGNILNEYNCHLSYTNDSILINTDKSKRLVVYPAMLKKPVHNDYIFISDYMIKYAKPYAVKIIADSI